MLERLIERIKSKAFWVSLISAVFLILGAFGVEIGDQTASTVINGISSALVMLGIATPSHDKKTSPGEDLPTDTDDGE